MPDAADFDLSTPDYMTRFRESLTKWLDEHDNLLTHRAPGSTLEEDVVRTRANQRVLWDAGWLRFGWPDIVGGFGGPPLLRASVAEEAAAREFVSFSYFGLTETLVPTVISVSPALASKYATDFLNGTAGWCQGFSEPDAGSDLASLRCRAVDTGDHWVVTGQKIWTSNAQSAARMLLLARTGTPESRHRGITAMLVDMDAPGVSLRPLHAINDRDEFSETFFDRVIVPKDRLIGEIDNGWSVAMSILRSERGGIFWMQSATLFRDLQRLVEQSNLSVADDERLGHVFVSIVGLRARSWTTQYRMGEGTIETPETSIDKILIASAEQELFDLAMSSLDGFIELNDSGGAKSWRTDYMYSRAASIYGGTGEIQRNILADQLLGLRGLQ